MSSDYSLVFPRAHGEPLGHAKFRAQPEDFYVDEDLGFTCDGAGEHVYLHIEKRGDNTEWLARNIARLAGVETRDVGYCGLKDRHAVTRQWFSVYFPKGDEPDWQALNSESVTLLAVERHRQKLRRGQHKSNRFVIVLREVQAQRDALEQRLQTVARQGVPNYFGEQRFGIDGGNLAAANRMLIEGIKVKNRHKRSLYLSSARSYLFNQVLAARIDQGCWRTPLPGDVLVDGAPTGPLWGRGRALSDDKALALEEQALAPWKPWLEPLEFTGLKQDRRALVSLPQQLSWQWLGDDLQLAFALGVGAYATAVLRELLELQTEPIML
ncbi:tRNA pseudouridine(13) synthase TruD [Gilvimarinus xylanilyticus]|uniref:tRNA pseudouridine synthase D n=1 Tax=Gilvimarinus xylanilyticus TaxID=2944139 RepID=A0A9X2HV39_9GAMM|nr:tRNA pseudouridine(13) synthase TruD [Gilvimarinus xylanilyticus]MCP8898983.1 tRNA pseudouridine(13) synthase TruD [Gilvimarinus xylanilyticus]